MMPGKPRTPTRAEELQAEYLRGQLPEQAGRAPRIVYCPDCHNEEDRRRLCATCEKRGIVRRPE